MYKGVIHVIEGNFSNILQLIFINKFTKFIFLIDLYLICEIVLRPVVMMKLSSSRGLKPLSAATDFGGAIGAKTIGKTQYES